MRLSGAVNSRASDSGNDPVYGAGAALKFGKIVAIRLEYERFKLTDIDNLNLTSIGVDFRF